MKASNKDSLKIPEITAGYGSVSWSDYKMGTSCDGIVLSTVEAELVRHGQWIEADVGDCCYRCSECGFIRDAYLLDISNYCPKCGAKMDLEKRK